MATFLPLKSPAFLKAASCSGSKSASGGMSAKSGAALAGNAPGSDPAITGVSWVCW